MLEAAFWGLEAFELGGREAGLVTALGVALGFGLS